MSGFDTPTKERGYATAMPSREAPTAAPRTPEEVARDATIWAKRFVADTEHTVQRVRTAQQANNYGAWQTAQTDLNKEIDGASRAIEKARGAGGAAVELDALVDRLAAVVSVIAQLDEPPKGFAAVTLEADLLAAIQRRPTPGLSISAGFQQKEADIQALLVQLPPGDSRNLAARIATQLPTDTLAAAFVSTANLQADRQKRLLDVLANAPRREVTRASKRDDVAAAPSALPPTDNNAPATKAEAPQSTAATRTLAAERPVPVTKAEASPAPKGTSAPASGSTTAHAEHAPAASAAPHGTVPAGPVGFSRVPSPPAGFIVIRAAFDVRALPPELCGNLRIGELKASAELIVADDRLVVGIDVNNEHWVAWLDPTVVLQAITGGVDVTKELGSAARFLHDLPSRVRQAGSRLHIALWGTAPNHSFAVIDLSRVIESVGHGSLAGLRPVESQILLGKAGGMRVFANEEIKAKTAIPGEPIGGWFELADDRLAAALASDTQKADGATVWCGAFYDDGVLRVAIKPSEDARTGMVAHIDLTYLLDRLSHFGDKTVAWANKVKAKVKDKSARVLDVVAGKMHLALPELSGTWFDFNLALQLPTLWHGHGLDLSALVPSSFHLDLGGLSLGAMPKVNWAWFASARFASFDVPWDRLAKLLGGIASLPAPKLPKLPFDLHFLGKLSLGVGIDLGVAWPELKDMGLGFELHLDQLFARAQAVGQWLSDKLGKLQGAADIAQKWLHLGSDGVLRIYDSAHADGPMLGFQLMKLLDGVDAGDLAPTELRWNPSGQFGLELGTQGEAAHAGQPGGAVTGQATPVKPAGQPAMQLHEPVPPELAAMLAIAPGAQAELAVYWSPGAQHVTLWAQAASALQGKPTTVKIELGYGGILDAVAKRMPAAKTHASLLVAPKLDTGNVVTFAFGDAARPATDKTKSGVTGTIGWKLARLLAAQDLTALEPDVMHVQADGIGGVELGAIHPPGPAIGESFAVSWPAVHQHLFHDEGTDVWVSAHAQGDLVALALTKAKDGTQGAMAQVHVSFLLHQLERLGKLGERALHAIAKAGHVVLGAATSFADKVARVAHVIGDKLMKIVDGVLQLPLADGQWLHWDLKAQLPRLGVDFDWSRLLPTFHLSFELGGVGALSLSWLAKLDVQGVHLPAIHLPALRLGKLLEAVPGIDLSKVKGALAFQLGWLPSEMSLDVGIDLSAVVDAFPDVLGGAGRALDFRVPLGKLLDKLEQKAAWAKRKLGKGGDALSAMSLGDDGVLRIHDAGDQNVIGFHLTRLLDGVDASDLSPTELRFSPSANVRLELGEQAGPDATKATGGRPDDKQPHKTAPAKPAGKPVVSVIEPAPAALAELLALKPGSDATMAVYWTPGAQDITLWAEAPSAVYDRPEAVKIQIGFAGVVDAVRKRLPRAKSAPNLPVVFKPGVGDMVTFAFGDAARDPGDKTPASGVTGRIGWKVSRLMAAHDLTALEPDMTDTSAEGIGALELGTIHPFGDAHGSFELAWPEAYDHLFHEPGSKLWVGAYAQDGMVGLSLTKTEGGKQGAMVKLSLEFLLRQLERLGKLGDKILHALAKLAHLSGELTGDVGAKAKVIASKLAAKLEPITSGMLKFPFDAGQWISWDLKRLPSLGLDFDWSKLVPSFHLALPAGRLGSLSMSWLPSLKVEGFKFPQISLPAVKLAHALDFLPGFDLSKLAGHVPFEIGWMADAMTIDIGIDLSPLFAAFPDLSGMGGAIGFRVPMGALVKKLEKVAGWAHKRLSKLNSPKGAIELGGDGVLRIHDDKGKNVIGFDLTRLLDGVDASDLVPVELKTEVDNERGESVIDLAYGEADSANGAKAAKTPTAKASTDKAATGDKEPAPPTNKVLVHKPSLPPLAHVAAPAPEAIRAYFGAAADAVIDLTAYLNGDDVIVFAALPHSDRGIEVHVHYQRLATSVKDAGPIKAPNGMAVSIAKQLNPKGMLVATFGPQPKDGEKLPEGVSSGHVAWKLEHLIAGDVAPYELRAANDKGSLTAGAAIPLAGLTQMTSFAVPAWAQGAVGADKGELWAHMQGDLKIAIVEAKAGKHDTARGVEIDLQKPFVDRIEGRLTALVTRAQVAGGRAAGALAGSSKAPRIHPRIERGGVVIERGTTNAPDHMYAMFSWEHLGQIATGDLSIETLMPVEFRVATKNAAFEVTEETKDGNGKPPPAGARQVKGLHELLRGPLNALGVKDVQWIAIETKGSRVESAGPDSHRVKLVADLYDVDHDSDHLEQVKVTGGHKLAASLDLEAVLAQVMPTAKKLFARKSASATKKPARLSGRIEAVDDFENTAEKDPGVKLTMHADLSTKKANRSLEIAAGWTLDQLIEVVLRMGDMVDGEGQAKQGSVVGLLAPTYLSGTFISEKYSIELGTVHAGHASQHTCPVPAVPGLAEILGQFMDPTTASKSTVHVELPTKTELIKSVKDALANGTFIRVVGCAIEVPREKGSRFYGAAFSLSPEILLKLASFIPELGPILKLAQAAVDFLHHPGETLEALAYTPELMYQFMKNLPDIVDRLREMSWKELAMALVFRGDTTTKQAVMAARLHNKLKSNPEVWAKVQAMKEKKSFSRIDGVSAEMLEYLSKQDEHALLEMLKLGQTVKQLGLDAADGPASIPTQPLNADAINAHILMLEHGYTDYAQAMDGAEQSKKAGKPVDQAELAKKAKALQEVVARYTSAGAKSLTVADARGADPKAGPVEVHKPEGDLTNVSGLPDPDATQIAQAQKMFQGGGPGGAHRVEVDYLVKKFAGLTTDQLAELLASGKSRVMTRNGEVDLPMFENERDFVRALFLQRVDPHAEQVASGEATQPKMSDAELVARWKAGTIGKHLRPGADTPVSKLGDGGTSKRTGPGKHGNGEGDTDGGTGATGTGTDSDDDGDSDVADLFGDETQLVAEANAEKSSKGNKGAEGAGSTTDKYAKPAESSALDPDYHVLNVTSIEAQRAVRVNDKTGKLELDPAAVAAWKTQYIFGARQSFIVHDVGILNEGKMGEGKDAAYLFRLIWGLWTVDKNAGKASKPHHTETTKRFEYSAKKRAIAEVHNDTALLDALRQRLKLVAGKVMMDENESPKVKSPEVALTILDVKNSSTRDVANNVWNVVLEVTVQSADEGYLLLGEDGKPFEAKLFVGTDQRVMVRGYLRFGPGEG